MNGVEEIAVSRLVPAFALHDASLSDSGACFQQVRHKQGPGCYFSSFGDSVLCVVVEMTVGVGMRVLMVLVMMLSASFVRCCMRTING